MIDWGRGREQTKRRTAGGPPPGRAHLLGRLLVAAMVAAPLLALLYGATAGLAVATLALAATAALAADAARAVAAPARRRLIVAAGVNAALALACLVALLVRLT